VHPGEPPRLPCRLRLERPAGTEKAPRRLLWAALACASAGCSTRPPESRIALSIATVEGECRFVAEGRSMSLEALTAAAAAWRRRGVYIAQTLETPYKCFGGAVFALQRAGVKKIGWPAEPPPAKD